mgnify:CR=1 FL=1
MHRLQTGNRRFQYISMENGETIKKTAFESVERILRQVYSTTKRNTKNGGERVIRIAIADDDAAFLAKIEKYIQKISEREW